HALDALAVVRIHLAAEGRYVISLLPHESYPERTDMSPKKIALPLDAYVRVSDVRGRSGDSFISPKEQEERCRALATARGYKVGDVFSDMDVSGGKMRRPELDRAIARIEEGVSGGIIVAKLDR